MQIYFDGFDGTTLRSDWISGSYGFGGQYDVMLNDEAQRYSPDAAYVRDGYLHLDATAWPDAPYGGSYKSGMIQGYGTGIWHPETDTWTRTKPISALYGYFEIRADVPVTNGMWTGFWFVNSDGGWPPELDITENIGSDPGATYQTVHSTDPLVAGGQAGFRVSAPDVRDGFHTFGAYWTAEKIDFYVDHVLTYSVATPKDMHSPMSPVINLAVGGWWPTYGNPVDLGPTVQQSMLVDYFGIWDAPYFLSTPTPPPPPPPPPPAHSWMDDNYVMTGTAAEDTLRGWNGNDTLTGGAGRDLFETSPGHDIVTDFNTSKRNGDLVLVEGGDFQLKQTPDGVLIIHDTGDLLLQGITLRQLGKMEWLV